MSHLQNYGQVLSLGFQMGWFALDETRLWLVCLYEMLLLKNMQNTQSDSDQKSN